MSEMRAGVRQDLRVHTSYWLWSPASGGSPVCCDLSHCDCFLGGAGDSLYERWDEAAAKALWVPSPKRRGWRMLPISAVRIFYKCHLRVPTIAKSI